jgi:hypothetical protein
LLLLISLFITNCTNDFELKSETKKNIELVKSNYKALSELIDISRELYKRNIDKKLTVSVFQDDYEISCEQVLNDNETNYCVGLHWNYKDIKFENKFYNQIHLDSLNLIDMRTKIKQYGIGRLELNNNVIEFWLNQSNFCSISYDLNIKLKSYENLYLECTTNLDSVDRPCQVEIGEGFKIKFEQLEHGISIIRRQKPAPNRPQMPFGRSNYYSFISF